MIKTLRNKPLRMVAIAVLPLALLGTACGSDDDGDSPTDTVSDAPADTAADTPADTAADAPTDTEAAGDESGGANPEVEAYCDEVDELVAAMDEVIEDPSSGDLADITAQGQELISAGTELAGSVDGDDTDRLRECTEALSDIGS